MSPDSFFTLDRIALLGFLVWFFSRSISLIILPSFPLATSAAVAAFPICSAVFEEFRTQPAYGFHIG